MKRELARKLIHVGTIGVPLLALAVPREVTVTVLVAALVVALAVEWARWRVRWFRHAFLRRTRHMLRPHERKGLAGATYMAIAYLLAVLLFPLRLAALAMLYNGVGDAVAALAGKRWGRHRTAWGKSWEGAIAGAAANIAVGALIPGIPLAAVLVGGISAAALEFLPLPLDDNLRVTLGGGAAAWAGALLVASALGA